MLVKICGKLSLEDCLAALLSCSKLCATAGKLISSYLPDTSSLARCCIAHNECGLMAGEAVTDVQLLTAIDRASKSATDTDTQAVLILLQQLPAAHVRYAMAVEPSMSVSTSERPCVY